MAVRKILIYPDPILRKKSAEVKIDAEQVSSLSPGFISVLGILEDMEDTLEEVDRGAALAAIQIGSNMRMIVMNQTLTARDGAATTTRPENPVIMSIPPYVINPVIVSRSDETTWVDEGCLSFPNFGMKVKRNDSVTVRYETYLKRDGTWSLQKIEETYEGFWAQVFQHEIDHLDGRLFVDALPQKKRLEIAKIIQRRR